jgi:hypothetical protein
VTEDRNKLEKDLLAAKEEVAGLKSATSQGAIDFAEREASWSKEKLDLEAQLKVASETAAKASGELVRICFDPRVEAS